MCVSGNLVRCKQNNNAVLSVYTLTLFHLLVGCQKNVISSSGIHLPMEISVQAVWEVHMWTLVNSLYQYGVFSFCPPML